MGVALKLDEMSIEEKVEVMEALWRDLSRSDAYVSPAWHGEVLEAREHEGEAPADWSEARERIRKRACDG